MKGDICRGKDCTTVLKTKGLLCSKCAITGGKCKIDKCDRLVTSKGATCNRHNYLKRHYGSYDYNLTHPTEEEIFWDNVDKSGECWVWKGYINESGYGLARLNKNQTRAHRVSWEIHHGKIPEGIFVCHKCDNPPCVNPSHLFLGTNQDNIQDKVNKGRSGRPNAKLKPSDIFIIKDLLEMNIPSQEIESLFNVSRQTISGIKFARRWKSVIKKYHIQQKLFSDISSGAIQ